MAEAAAQWASAEAWAAAAMEAAVRAEIGDGRAARAGDGEGGGGTTVNIGTVVMGGADGVTGALSEVLDRLRDRRAALGENANEPGS